MKLGFLVGLLESFRHSKGLISFAQTFHFHSVIFWVASTSLFVLEREFFAKKNYKSVKELLQILIQSCSK